MRINDILLESEIQDLEEGPKWDAIKKAGTAVGRAAGGAAQAVGAIPGAIAGAGNAFMKGYRGARDTVAGGPDAAPAATTAAAPAANTTAPANTTAAPANTTAATTAAAPAANTTAPANTTAAPANTTAAPTSAKDINAAGPTGTAAAKTQTGAAAQALNKTAQATKGATADKIGQTLYAQIKSQVNQLDKKGKQRILQLLQKSLQQSAPAKQSKPDVAGGMSRAANTTATTPTKTAAAKPDVAGGMSRAANAPADTTAAPTAPADTTAAPTAPAEKPKGRRGSRTANTTAAPAEKPKGRRGRNNNRTAETPPATASQAEIDADRDRLLPNFTDSVIITGNNLSEMFNTRVNLYKKKYFAEGIANGSSSIYRKR